AKQVFEDVGEGRRESCAEARPATARALLKGSVAEAVIVGWLLAVLEDLVGLVDFPEEDFAPSIALILLRLPLLRELPHTSLHRELAEGRLQLAIVGGAFDLQGLVVAALGGHWSVPNSRPSRSGDAFGKMQRSA